MAFIVIDFGLDPNHASIVTNEDGTTKYFDTVDAARDEAVTCQEAKVICTDLEMLALFDANNMIDFLRNNTFLSVTQALEAFEKFFSLYKQQYES